MWVSECFYKESKSKKKEKKYFFLFSVLQTGMVSDFFYKQSKSTQFFWVGGGMEGVGWRGGSAARVSEFFLQIIQI